MTDAQTAVVVGVGPGLGAAVARRYAREGFAVGLMARDEQNLEPVRQQITKIGARCAPLPCDATAPESVQEAFARLRQQLGEPEVLVYNAGSFRMGGVAETDPEVFEHCWRANCYGGFLSAREVLPQMADRGRGTVIFSGATASLRGGAQFSCLAVGKFGLRALAQSAAREFGPRGVHVAHVVIDGQILTPRAREMFPDREEHTFLSPDAIAETYWQLHCQDPTAWTHEVDLRPAVEKF